ncbi:HNH endonuclease [Brachybacterium kimchii]|uniref:HNH endonuclease n=1 Tax=Brachybacterium kimchii TaxID=2942909 RepID=A0ABY4N4F5_9MICO|nr:hypothetical protein [Brachybacterium kimchii]UQN29451.1 hypothetical protein M4486_17730 [Brachybacterium kimchii]
MTRPRVPRDVAELVRWRDRDQCQRCGVYTAGGSIHHRQGRGGDSPHSPANLVLLCGSGTTGCHGWVHAHPAAAYAAGLMVRRLGILTPAEVPITTPRGEVYLLPDGSTSLTTHPMKETTA